MAMTRTGAFQELASLFAVLASIGWGCPGLAADTSLSAVPFHKVEVKDGFWTPRIETNRTSTIAANLRQCEMTGRIRNFAVAAKLEAGKHEGFLFNDSDVYKVLEGIAYALQSKRDPALESQADAIIDKIAAAQQPDGYLNTYYTLVKPKERWQNIQHGHELYCAGHLIEAGVAYHQATGKRKLLDVAIRFADHICDTFGPGRKVDTSGHEEIEPALVKLHRETGNRKYLDQARFFLDIRGQKGARRLFGDYAQDHIPIREQTEVAGHAVRAMYLYCGMADVAALTGDATLRTPLERIWEDLVQRKMYITGGIGPSAHNEGFTVPYDLPNDTAYAETCAAIGMALWCHRMFLLTGDGKYADVLEKEVYNGLLSGVALSGDRFFYTNPLGDRGRHRRGDWFPCACCPPNIVRYIPGIGERAYAYRDNAIFTVLYMGSQAEIPLKGGLVKVSQETRYPWEGDIAITVQPEKSFEFEVCLRIPAWAGDGYQLDVPPACKVGKPANGYVKVSGLWRSGDQVRLRLPMEVKRVHAPSQVKANVDRVALTRGPVVYCLEGVDNGGRVRNLVLPSGSKLEARFDPALLGGVVKVVGEGLAVIPDTEDRVKAVTARFQAIPYFAWANRQPGEMVVWMPEKNELAELPEEYGVPSNGIRVRASHCFASDTVTALNDERIPSSSGDHGLPRMTWWDRRGSTEWVAYTFPRPRTITGVEVYWFDDTGRGACRVPASWQLFWHDGKDWRPVQLAEGSSYGTDLDRFNRIAFSPVTTRQLKLEVKLKPNVSGGILEWKVLEK